MCAPSIRSFWAAVPQGLSRLFPLGLQLPHQIVDTPSGVSAESEAVLGLQLLREGSLTALSKKLQTQYSSPLCVDTTRRVNYLMRHLESPRIRRLVVVINAMLSWNKVHDS